MAYVLIRIIGVLSLVCSDKSRALKCHSVNHPNGSATYYLSSHSGKIGGCFTEWSSDKKPIAYEGVKNDSLVLSRTDDFLTTLICLDFINYKEECPVTGVISEITCPCNCRTQEHVPTTPNSDINQGDGNGVYWYWAIIIIIIIIIIIGCVAYHLKRNTTATSDPGIRVVRVNAIEDRSVV